jgi:hypothetical protein
MCRSTCSSDADCNGKGCDLTTGSCGKTRNGDQCSSDSDCTNGHCVDKTCCASASCGTCESCASSDGTCQPVADGQPDPDSCSSSSDPCGTTGKCDGHSHCKYASPGTDCGQTCSADQLGVVGQTCDGNGVCNGTGTTKSCQGFLCVTDHCANTCDGVGCAPDKVCTNNICQDPPPDGGM